MLKKFRMRNLDHLEEKNSKKSNLFDSRSQREALAKAIVDYTYIRNFN